MLITFFDRQSQVAIIFYRSVFGRQGCLTAHSYECFALDYRRLICVFYAACEYQRLVMKRRHFVCARLSVDGPDHVVEDVCVKRRSSRFIREE